MTSTGRTVLLRGMMVTALALGAGGIPIGVTAQAAVGVRIARQDMSTALLAFSRQSGKQILFSPTLVRGKTARAVTGRMEVRDALATILKGSGLGHKLTPSGAYLIVDAQDQSTGDVATARAVTPTQDSTATQAAPEEPAPDIVVMSTQNGARAMNRLDDFGTLETGKIADLLVLSENPNEDVRAFRGLTHVMRAGVLREQKELAYP